jgi:tetratricopeptide (TPR) repeat protein
VPLNARLVAYTKAMEQMTQRYPDDFEAWTYYALTLQASAPKNDKTYGNQLKSAEILERLLKQNPEHPGVAHYLIHAYDYPPLADKGIRIAGQYARIAPAAPHARHMPSHIYSMVGMWEESIASNRSALEVQPDYHHATDFMVYAHLQLAQDAKAKALVDLIVGLPQREYPILPNFTAVAAIPARYALERADWAGAAALPVSSTGRVMAYSLTRFSRGLGMARSGDLAGAKREVQALQELRSALEQSSQSYWADRTQEQILAVGAWWRTQRARATRRRSSCALPPTVKMAVSSMWRWRTRSIQCASCSVSCCSRSGSQRPRWGSSRPRSRRTRTAIGASPGPRAPLKPPVIGRRPSGTSRSSSR